MSARGAPGGLVAINGRAAVRSEIGGVERYAREVIARLPGIAPGRYRVLAPRPRLVHRAGHAWEQCVLPAAARGCALIYSPANLAPVAGRRNVVVIHDVAALAAPEAYSRQYAAYQRLMLPTIARRAALVITVSEFSRGQIVERLHVDPQQVAVIQGGVGSAFTPGADGERAAATLGIHSPYVLTIATASARKNLDALATAARALRARGVDLLLAGSDRCYLRGGDGGLRRLGYVPEPVLPGLYAAARAVVIPSRYEGFGLPAIEAMACGTPVVAAAAGALPQTCGDAAMLVDPDDPGAIAEALLLAVFDEQRRERMIGAGRRRAAELSWNATAAATDAAIEGVLGGAATLAR